MKVHWSQRRHETRQHGACRHIFRLRCSLFSRGHGTREPTSRATIEASQRAVRTKGNHKATHRGEPRGPLQDAGANGRQEAHAKGQDGQRAKLVLGEYGKRIERLGYKTISLQQNTVGGKRKSMDEGEGEWEAHRRDSMYEPLHPAAGGPRPQCRPPHRLAVRGRSDGSSGASSARSLAGGL